MKNISITARLLIIIYVVFLLVFWQNHKNPTMPIVGLILSIGLIIYETKTKKKTNNR
jgi:FtsH-binding integral membrane protein